MLTGIDNESAIDVLPLINTQDFKMDMIPPLNSIPERIRAMLHVINVFAMTTEYAIPVMMVRNNEGIWSFSKKLKAMKRTQKQVAFAEMITTVFQSCVWRMELKIPVNEGSGLYRSTVLTAWITKDFASRREEREKGRTRIEVEMVWESLRVRTE